MIICVLLTWIVSAGLSVPPKALEKENIFEWIVVALIVVHVVLSIVGYSIITLKIRASRLSSRGCNVPNGRFTKCYLVPFLLTSSYILLYSIPFMLFAVGQWSLIVNTILDMLVTVGYGMDPVLYIFLLKHYRDDLMKRLPNVCEG